MSSPGPTSNEKSFQKPLGVPRARVLATISLSAGTVLTATRPARASDGADSFAESREILRPPGVSCEVACRAGDAGPTHAGRVQYDVRHVLHDGWVVPELGTRVLQRAGGAIEARAARVDQVRESVRKLAVAGRRGGRAVRVAQPGLVRTVEVHDDVFVDGPDPPLVAKFHDVHWLPSGNWPDVSLPAHASRIVY